MKLNEAVVGRLVGEQEAAVVAVVVLAHAAIDALANSDQGIARGAHAVDELAVDNPVAVGVRAVVEQVCPLAARDAVNVSVCSRGQGGNGRLARPDGLRDAHVETQLAIEHAALADPRLLHPAEHVAPRVLLGPLARGQLFFQFPAHPRLRFSPTA